MLRTIAAIALACATGAASAVDDKAIAQCAAVQNTVERLACFDELSSEHGLAQETNTTTPSGSGLWQTSTKLDPLTDNAVHTAMLFASSGRARFGTPIALFVRCKDNKTEMYVAWNDYLGRDGTRVTYRLDKEPAKTSRWGLSTDNKATFFPGSPVPLLRSMASSTSFVANVTPFNESPVTAVFDTKGADVALADIRKGCNW